MIFLHNSKQQLKFKFSLNYFLVIEPDLTYAYFQHGKTQEHLWTEISQMLVTAMKLDIH